MTFHELLKQCDSFAVANKLAELFYNKDEFQADKYEHFFKFLVKLKPLNNKEYEIHVYEAEDIYDKTTYTNVSAWNIEEEQYYAISYMNREEILGMEIESESFDAYEKNELVANILWEISYVGFYNEQVETKINYLYSLIKE